MARRKTPNNGAALGFEEKLWLGAAKLEEQFAESARLEQMIRVNLTVLGFLQ